MSDVLLALGIGLVLVYGFWVMKRLDRFLDSGRIEDDDSGPKDAG